MTSSSPAHGAPLATLALKAATHLTGLPWGASAEAQRTVWAGGGVLVGEQEPLGVGRDDRVARRLDDLLAARELLDAGREAEAAELMQAYGLAEPGRDRWIRTTYDLLGWFSFLTAGEPECRAWTIRRGMTAAEAAGAIHSDIQRGFIKAEVVNWEDLLAAGNWSAAREAGKLRLEGRDYVVQDGDVILFRHSG